MLQLTSARVDGRRSCRDKPCKLRCHTFKLTDIKWRRWGKSERERDGGGERAIENDSAMGNREKRRTPREKVIGKREREREREREARRMTNMGAREELHFVTIPKHAC